MLANFGQVLEPREAAEPILSRGVRNALLEWLTEIWAEDDLRSVNLAPRRRAIFDGKPGTGKTTLAHHLAARLGLPMLAVRPDRLIDKWLGSTGRNVGQMFDAAAVEPVVLFIDEFDAIAVKRKDASTGAEDERNAVTNTLLQCIDRYQGFLIAATNFPDHIDPAAWRRFDIHITLDLPGQFECERILARYLDPFGLPAPALKDLAESFATASPALMRQFCEGLKRQIVIGPRCGWDMGREAVVERLIASIQPHPQIGKPRLWSLGAKDRAIRSMPWPLQPASEIATEPSAPSSSNGDKVIEFKSRGAA